MARTYVYECDSCEEVTSEDCVVGTAVPSLPIGWADVEVNVTGLWAVGPQFRRWLLCRDCQLKFLDKLDCQDWHGVETPPEAT